MRKLITAIAACLFIMGCAGTPQEKAADKMKDMQDDKTALVNKGVVAGLGIGTSKNKQLAYDEADLNARVDVQRAMEEKIEGLIRNYIEDVGDELTEHKEEVKKGVVSGIQKGVSIVKMDVEVAENGKYEVYAIAVMDPQIIKNAFEAELSARQANIERARAMAGYQELEKATAALEAYKASQGR